MGGKSSSSSSSSTTTNTQNLNLQRIEAPVVVGDGDILYTDHGAVQSAFEVIDNISAESQHTLRTLNADVLDFAYDTSHDAFTLVDDASQQALDFAADASRAAYTWANESVKTEVAQSYDRLVKYSAGAVTLIGVATAIAVSMRK